MIHFRPLTIAQASAIAGWRYRGRFAAFDMIPSDIPELLRPEYRYRAGLIDGALVGFYCAGPDAQVTGGDYADGEPAVIDFGLGLPPERLGLGLGRSFAAAGLDHAVAALSPARVRVTIAHFNLRSLAVFEGLGFVRTHRFRRPDGQRFIQLERERLG